MQQELNKKLVLNSKHIKYLDFEKPFANFKNKAPAKMDIMLCYYNTCNFAQNSIP